MLLVAGSHDMTTVPWHPFVLATRVLSERLQGCDASEQLRAIVCSQNVQWERVVGHASAQFVLPAFAAALQDLDLMEPLDEELSGFLAAVHAANAERNSELFDELAAAVGVLNRADIQPVLLKGAIRLVDGLYPDPGWRTLRDLDLLVPAAKLAEAIRAFEEVGYARANVGANALVPGGGLAQIDLHQELFSTSRQTGLLQAAEVIGESRSIAFGEGAVRLPSIEHQLVHLIAHGQIKDSGHALGRVVLRDGLEAAALMHWAPESVDWRAVFARFEAAGYRRPLLTFLLSLNDGDWYAIPTPGRIDLLTTLQRRRIALQARSKAFAQFSLRAGWGVSELKQQFDKSDAGPPRAIENLKRLICERGAVRKMARALADRQPLLAHLLAYLGGLAA